ncbi:unnamed protein product [Alternaria burnsii]|nr:unnamed protein product [Alternaria burnsii]
MHTRPLPRTVSTNTAPEPRWTPATHAKRPRRLPLAAQICNCQSHARLHPPPTRSPAIALQTLHTRVRLSVLRHASGTSSGPFPHRVFIGRQRLSFWPTSGKNLNT